MIVQSFCFKCFWFDDYWVFVEVMGFLEVLVGIISLIKVCDGVELWIGWVVELIGGLVKWFGMVCIVFLFMELGWVQLLKFFFMCDMFYLEVVMIYGLNNVLDDLELVIKVGKWFCEELFELLQDYWGWIVICFVYCLCEVNGFCNDMQCKKKVGYICVFNESNYVGYIWDCFDDEGYMGVMVCVVVLSFWVKYQEFGDW